MKISKGFISTIVMMIIICTFIILVGCTSTGSNKNQSGISTNTQTANQPQAKVDIKMVTKELVLAGTLTKEQADKVLTVFESNPNIAPGPNGPLASLVSDNIITEEQQNAIMGKMFGAPLGNIGGNMGGGMTDTSSIKTKYLDVAYATESSSQKLDIYLPNTGNGPFPVIMAIHGGGFRMGDKNSSEVNDELVGLDRGYAVVCVNYRLSGESTFPAAVYDVKAAVRFIKANASKYNVNPKKIAAWGDSAGGNLAAMLGTSAGVKSVEDLSMGNADQTSDVQAVVDFFGPINFLTMDDENKVSGIANAQVHDTENSFESQYMGAKISTIPDKVKKANPTTYISQNTVPFFIENGTDDANVPTAQSVNFAAALEEVIGKNKVTYIKLQGAGHGGSQFDSTDNLNKVFEFLDKYLK